MSTAVLLPVVIGLLYAVGIYLLLRRSLIKILFGLVLLGNATNLLVFTSARITKGDSPLIEMGSKVLPEGSPDPLVQALILTAIVISFGTLAFAMTLIKRAYEVFGSDDAEALLEPEGDES